MTEAAKHTPTHVEFLQEAARFFDGCAAKTKEDVTFWQNAYNAENCRGAADRLEAQERLIEKLTAALEEVVAVSKSGADTISFLTDLHRVAKLCAAALSQAKRIEQP